MTGFPSGILDPLDNTSTTDLDDEIPLIEVEPQLTVCALSGENLNRSALSEWWTACSGAL